MIKEKKIRTGKGEIILAGKWREQALYRKKGKEDKAQEIPNANSNYPRRWLLILSRGSGFLN